MEKDTLADYLLSPQALRFFQSLDRGVASGGIKDINGSMAAHMLIDAWVESVSGIDPESRVGRNVTRECDIERRYGWGVPSIYD